MSNFWDSFAEGFKGAMAGVGGGEYVQALQQKRMAEMRMDAEMGIRGFQRMGDFEVKQHLAEQKLMEKTKGYVAEGGAVLPPEGTKAVNGQLINKQGEVVGEYAPGYEPKPLANQVPRAGDILNVGRSYYKFNPELAQKMGAEGVSQQDLVDMRDKIKRSFPTAQGNWIPSTVRMGASTYRYQPTMQEQSPDIAFQDWQGGNQGQSVATQPRSPIAQANPMTLQMRQAVGNAIQNKIPRAEILKGIQDEGMNPNDFADLIGTYDENISPLRRNLLGNTLTNAGLRGVGVIDIMQALSSMLDEKKKQLKQKESMSQTGVLP